jgi:hypothetical protein
MTISTPNGIAIFSTEDGEPIKPAVAEVSVGDIVNGGPVAVLLWTMISLLKEVRGELKQLNVKADVSAQRTPPSLEDMMSQLDRVLPGASEMMRKGLQT